MITVSTDEDTDELSRSLCEWLNRDQDLHGTARLEPRPIQRGDLGAPPDLIVPAANGTVTRAMDEPRSGVG